MSFGFFRFIAYTLFSFTEDFAAIIVLSGNVLKTYVDQFAGVFSSEGQARYELVVWQIHHP
jgi:hypothetical protein